jgi:hypothetical protein
LGVESDRIDTMRGSPSEQAGPAGDRQPAGSAHSSDIPSWGRPATESADEPVFIAPGYRTKVSVKPALVVIACVAVVFVFGVGLAFASYAPNSVVKGPPLGKPVADGLVPVSAKPALDRILSAGEPPSNVIESLTVPRGTHISGTANLSRGIGQYDESVTLSVPDAPSMVAQFYTEELRAYHWSFLGTAPLDGHSGEEILAKLGSNDGYYWEVGVVIKPVTVLITPALAGSDLPAGPTTQLELRIFEMPSPD